MELLTGFAIAVIVGMTGMGGGPLAAPIFILALGLPVTEAVGTSLVFVTIVKLFASPLYILRKQVDYRVLRYMMLGGLPGVAIGTFALSKLNTKAAQPLVLALVGFTIVVLAVISVWRLLSRGITAGDDKRARWIPWLTLPIGLEVGFSSAGAGALGSLVMMYCSSIPASMVVGTDLLFGLALSTFGGGLHLAAGNWNAPLFWKLAAGGAVGAMFGSWLATRVPAKPLRAGLSFFLVFLGGQLCWKGVQVLVR